MPPPWLKEKERSFFFSHRFGAVSWHAYHEIEAGRRKYRCKRRARGLDPDEYRASDKKP
jgi:hypothetical protein